MSNLLTGIGTISAGLFIITLVIGTVVKMVMHLLGKSVVTPNHNTRRMLFFSFIVFLCSMLISFLGNITLMVLYSLSSFPILDKAIEFFMIAFFITISIYIYFKLLTPKIILNSYWKGTLLVISVLLPLYSIEQLIKVLSL